MIDFIHIGDYKTGTTWLQKYFYPNHPEIDYLGGPFNNVDLEHILHILIDSRDLDFQADQIRIDIAKYFKNSNPTLITGICREVFSGSNFISCDNANQNAQRLFSVFGKVKIIFIIREQISMITSIYSTYLKMGGTLSIRDFIYDPIVSRGLIERVKWHKQILMYQKIFGEENVHIGLFEEFISNKKLFLNKICDHLGIDDYNVSDNQGIVVNKKLTNHGAYICRKGNNYLRSTYNNSRGNLLLVKILSLLTSSRQLSELIKDTEKRIVPNYGKYDLKQRKMHALNWRGVIIFRRIAEKIKFGKPISIPDDIKKQLTQHCKESNNSLIKCFNLPVDKYNYSI